MANVSHIITLGIGTPSGIAEFLTLGLQIGEESVGNMLSDNVAMRFIAGGDIAVRTVASGNSSIRITASGDTEI